MTINVGPVSIERPPRFSERMPYVVTCREHPDFRSEHYFETPAWEAVDEHRLSHVQHPGKP